MQYPITKVKLINHKVIYMIILLFIYLKKTARNGLSKEKRNAVCLGFICANYIPLAIILIIIEIS